jgi:hypothetical protein
MTLQLCTSIQWETEELIVKTALGVTALKLCQCLTVGLSGKRWQSAPAAHSDSMYFQE